MKRRHPVVTDLLFEITSMSLAVSEDAWSAALLQLSREEVLEMAQKLRSSIPKYE